MCRNLISRYNGAFIFFLSDDNRDINLIKFIKDNDLGNVIGSKRTGWTWEIKRTNLRYWINNNIGKGFNI